MANKKNVGRKQIDPDNILYKIDADHQRRILGPPGDPKSHVPKLLAKLRDLNIDSFGEIVQRVKAQFPNDYAKEGHKIDLKNPELIAALFEPATQIDGKNRAVDRSIVAAFEKSGLNIGNPTDWQLLMGMFCSLPVPSVSGVVGLSPPTLFFAKFFGANPFQERKGL